MPQSNADDLAPELKVVGPPAEQMVGLHTERIHRAGRDALVLRVVGEIDELTVDQLRAAVTDALEQVATQPAEVALVLDLTAVGFLGSAGLQALVDATRAAQQRREPLRIVVDHNRPVIRPIEITGLDDMLALYTTLDQALHVPY